MKEDTRGQWRRRRAGAALVPINSVRFRKMPRPARRLCASVRRLERPYLPLLVSCYRGGGAGPSPAIEVCAAANYMEGARSQASLSGAPSCLALDALDSLALVGTDAGPILRIDLDAWAHALTKREALSQHSDLRRPLPKVAAPPHAMKRITQRNAGRHAARLGRRRAPRGPTGRGRAGRAAAAEPGAFTERDRAARRVDLKAGRRRGAG